MSEEISVEELKKERRRSDPLIVDVREQAELSEGTIPQSVFIPMSQLLSRLSELPKDRSLVFVCATGGRSLVAVRFLSKKG